MWRIDNVTRAIDTQSILIKLCSASVNETYCFISHRNIYSASASIMAMHNALLTLLFPSCCHSTQALTIVLTPAAVHIAYQKLYLHPSLHL